MSFHDESTITVSEDANDLQNTSGDMHYFKMQFALYSCLCNFLYIVFSYCF